MEVVMGALLALSYVLLGWQAGRGLTRFLCWLTALLWMIGTMERVIRG